MPTGGGPRAWRRLNAPEAAATPGEGSGEVQDYGIFRVRRLLAENPRNQSARRLVLLDAPDWVNVIPITPAGELVLIRQFRFGPWRNTLEIPGGVVEPDESPADAAARELEEETGYRAARWEPLGAVHANPAIQNNRLHCFLALDCQPVHQGTQDEGEDIAVELHRPDRLPELVASGEMSHALVLTAFFLHQLRSERPPTR